MLIVTVLLTILAIIIAYVSWKNCDDAIEFISSIGAVLFGIIDFIIILVIICCGADMFTIKDKIKMYEEENSKIEEQLTEIVQNYQGYEKETISNIADMEVAFIKFPELKTSELVSKQMNVYIENNNKIKELKQKKIDTKIYKWLLYFGK